MKIAAIRCDRTRFPLDPPFHAAWDPVPRRHFDATLVRVTTDEGVVGVGSGGTIEPLPGGDWAGLRSLRGRLRCAAAPVRRAWPPVRRAWPPAGAWAQRVNCAVEPARACQFASAGPRSPS